MFTLFFFSALALLSSPSSSLFLLLLMPFFFFKLAISSKNAFLMLLMLEFIMIINLMALLHLTNPLISPMTPILVFLTSSVVEATVGVSLLVKLARAKAHGFLFIV